jgi:hypothetical protein
MPTWYCTVEDVRDALEEKASAYDLAAIKRAIAAGSDDVDDVTQLNGGNFRPRTETRYYRWPDQQTAYYYRLWLDGNQLISVDTLTSGGDTIPSTDYYLEPQQYGPPYNRIEINLSRSSAFGFAGTPQRAIAVTGLWGHTDDQEAAGTLVGGINASVTSLIVSDGSKVGIGDHLKIGTERLEVTDRTWTAVTGGDTAGSLSASNADRTLAVADGTKYHTDEVLLLNSERLKVVDIAGNNLTVLRAQDGSVLATHTSSTTVYASRSLTVTRGAQGSTAASHLDGVAVTRHVVPGAVRELALASALTSLLAGRRGYAQAAGPQGAALMKAGSLDELRERVANLHGRQARTRVV